MIKFRLILLSLFLSLFFIDAKSQQLNLTEVNANNFPKVEVGVTALNRFGDTEQDLKLSEFRVIENGVDVTSSLSIDCFGGTEPQEMNVILVIDKSGSMKKDEFDPNSIRLFDWVEKAVDIFLKDFTFYQRSQVGIVAFAGRSEVRCPFTQDPKRLLDSLKKTELAGPTDYNYPLIGQSASVMTMYRDLPADYKSTMKTVVIFLTDGQPSAQSPTRQFEIVDSLKAINAQMYSITLLTDMNAGLEYISEQTGGRATKVNTEQDLINIYKLIASEIQNKVFCVLRWDSPLGCDPNNLEREVRVTFTRSNVTTTKRYNAPPNSIAQTTFPDEVVAFGNPPVDGSTVRTASFVATKGDMKISDLKILPAGPYFQILSVKVKDVEVGRNFTLKEGDTAYVEIEFTQKDKIDYRPANLVIEGTPCERVLPIYGGVSDVVLLSPNSGFFRNCDDILIRWGGVDPQTPVNIYYSTNDGATWVLLQKDAKNLSYIWTKDKFPTTGNKYRIKLEVLPIYFYQLAKSFGNATENYGRTIALSNDSLNLYFTGYYTGTIRFDNVQFTSAGSTDLYIVKTDNLGNVLWAKSAGGSERDTAYGVAVDDEGNAYITGTIRTSDVNNNPVLFGGSSASIYHKDRDVFFIAKYDKEGKNAPIVYTLSYEGPARAGFQGRGVNLRVTGSGANTRIRVIGNYSDKIQFSVGVDNFSLSDKNTEFEAIFDKNLKLITLTETIVNRNTTPPFARDSAYDVTNDLKYKIGSFTGTRNYAPYSLTSVGQNDIFFTKYGKNKESIDISNSTFAIEKPTLKFLLPNYTFPAQRFGEGNSIVFTASLANITNLPIEITDKNISTGNNTDFSITNMPSRIEANDTVNVEIEFRPGGVGSRTSKLFVQGECTDVIQIDLIGTGTCNTTGVTEVQMGSTNLNIAKKNVVSNIFVNPNEGAIRITPTIINDPASEFKILTVNGINYTGTAIDVNGLESVEMEIEFTPKNSGVRTARIDYKVSNGCDNFFTNLTGNGVDNEVFAEVLDFGRKRIKTVNEMNLVLKNSSSLANKIVSLSILDNTFFKLKNTLNFPLDIAANGEITIPVLFTPQTETNYATKVEYRLEASSDTFEGDLIGIGVNPQLTAELICPNPSVKEGETGQATLRLTNNSTLEVTKLGTLNIAIGDFTFSANNQKTITGLADIAFNGGRLDIPITFSPQASGPQIVRFNIEADVAVGNDVDATYPQFQNVVLDAACSARSLGGVETVDFGNVLYCDTKVMNLQIPANENIEDLVIDFTTPLVFSGPDAAYFTHSLTNAINPIKYLESRDFQISFKPDANRTYNATLVLPNNLGQNITYVINAVGVIPQLSNSKDSEVTFAPGGDGVTLYYSANIPRLDNGPITELTTLIYFNNKMVYFPIDKATNQIKVTSDLPNWVWGNPTLIADGVLEIKGTGTLPTPVNRDLYSLTYKIYLGDVAKSNIEFATEVNDCIQDKQIGTIVNLGNMCFVDGRLVDLSDVQFGTDVAPNPATSEMKMKVGIGFDVPTKIEIVNTMGEVVLVPMVNEMKKGVYDVTIPVNNLANGLYLVRVTAGPYIETKTVIIQK